MFALSYFDIPIALQKVKVLPLLILFQELFPAINFPPYLPICSFYVFHFYTQAIFRGCDSPNLAEDNRWGDANFRLL